MDTRDTRARLMTLLRGVAELSGHGGYAERGPVYEWIHQQGWYGAHESTRLRQDLTRLMESKLLLESPVDIGPPGRPHMMTFYSITEVGQQALDADAFLTRLFPGNRWNWKGGPKRAKRTEGHA